MAGELRYDHVNKSFRKRQRKPGLLSEFLSRRRPESHPAIRDFSAHVNAGEKVLIHGPNGSGKSTLIKLAVGLYLPDSGRVSLDGVPVTRADRSRIGVMISNQLLYGGLSGYQNLELSAQLYGCKDARARVDAAVSRWNLRDYAHHRVDGYSNGMKSMLALARATVHDPDILFLDEPFMFLDEVNSALLASHLRAASCTVVLTSQTADRREGAVDRLIPL